VAVGVGVALPSSEPVAKAAAATMSTTMKASAAIVVLRIVVLLVGREDHATECPVMLPTDPG
jgi:hypothetical protein